LKKKDDEVAWQRKSLAHPNRAASLFKPGNKMAVGNKGNAKRQQKRFITIAYINSLADEIERTKTVIKSKKTVRTRELVTKEQMMIEALFIGFCIDRNPSVMRLVMEMIEGRNPQAIDLIKKNFHITADMNLADASRLYLESIKRTSLDDEDDE
jgi:high-affinity K+ transport system ATPase subunit B